MDLVVFHHKDDAIGVLYAKFNAIGVSQLVALHLRAINKHAVAAVQILQQVEVLILGDANVLARYPAVAQDELIVGLTPDGEWHWLDDGASAVSGWINYNERSARHGARWRTHAFFLFVGACGSICEAAASATSLARRTWQCEQYPPISVRASTI